MKTYRFTWTETHSHDIRAESQDEADKEFYQDSEEGFGGRETYVTSDIDAPEIEEVPE